ncbi:MAG: 2-C-methyl-D-erythritol 2,4-cyclodiphosphate synthase [Mycoplasmataceae bacterium]|jgi:2-C-methyl-D-erythritol 2,4-cyclodiphosphate synthase|nr:2-C-methyl-D-erythritol 2,4-cyclodiphosphate synthase [Mycoplasmataceae bacterium]
MYLIGQGNDTHNLEKQDSIIKLGGYRFQSKYKVIAHSDGDVVLHSISNAILGAIQLGDIGEYFSDKDIKNKNVDSRKIVDFTLRFLKKKHLKIINIDLTITCENILLMKIKKEIVKSLQNILKTKLINVKATRFEKPCNQIRCDSIVLLGK